MYAACLCIGAAIGAIAASVFSTPSVKDAATLGSNQLRLSYGLVASPREKSLPDNIIALNVKEALAIQFINIAPLYHNLDNDKDKIALSLISKNIINSKIFDAIDKSDIRENAYASAECIAALSQTSTDPMPCLESNSKQRMANKISMR
jgi:hypothetical protein